MDNSSAAIIHSCQHCCQWVVNFNQTRQQRHRTCLEKVRRILRNPQLEFTKVAEMSLTGISLLEMTVKDIENAVVAGCQLAVQLTGMAFPVENIKEIKRTWHRAGPSCTFAARLLNPNQCDFGVLQLSLCPQDGFRVKLHEFGFSSLLWEILTFRDDPASRDFSQIFPNLNPGSEDTFCRVRDWMESCHRDHPSCSLQHEESMPKRLIAISSHGLQLREMEDRDRQKYAALSYCWGGDQPFKLTNSSLYRLMNRFCIEDLPSCLRDAVILTQKLGLSFLWVDVLCIIQDNDLDKGTEISRMPAIYENAVVTIVASRTQTVYESFLRPRKSFYGLCFDSDANQELFGLPYRCQDGQLGTIILMHEVHSRTEPINERAWTLQERLLSPRIIEYGSTQTRWICRTSREQGGFTDGWLNLRSGTAENFLIQNPELIPRLNAPNCKTITEARYQWYELLALYTHRDLTRKTDRLPAISGIAQRYAEFLGAEYVAGLWKPWLAEELLWKQRQNVTHAYRPTEYQGPSWSWAGINMPIEIELLSSSERWSTISHPDSSVRALSNVSHINMNRFIPGDAFEVIDYFVDPVAPHTKFGQLRSAQLTLRGRLRPAILSSELSMMQKASLLRTRQRSTQTSQGFLSRVFRGSSPTLEMLCLDVYMDCPQDDFPTYGRLNKFPYQSEMQVSLFLIGQYDKTYCGLILVRLSSGYYFRVGVFFSSFSRDPDGFPSDSQEQWEARQHEQIFWLLSSELQTISLV